MDLKQHSMLAKGLSAQDPLKVLLLNAADVQRTPDMKSPTGIYWGADHYRLSHTSAYKGMTESKQDEVLRTLSHWSLSLSYFIEKFGLNYGAYMIATAESTEEKSLYGIFTGDEVRHRLWLEPFICSEIPSNLDFHPLLNTLSLCLREGTKEAMIFTIQVVLEGFGISHYASLRDTCLSPALQQVFTDILKDEAHHHGMGVVLSQRLNLDPVTREQVEELTMQIVRSLIDAEWVLKAMELTTEGFATKHKALFKEETQWQEQIQHRILRIKSLIKKVGYQGLLESLESKGAFRVP